jgi:hypothetical protein
MVLHVSAYNVPMVSPNHRPPPSPPPPPQKKKNAKEKHICLVNFTVQLYKVFKIYIYIF